MSTTVIDELIVRLGLDSKSLDSKSGSATKNLKGLEEQGKKTEGGVKKIGDASKSAARGVDELARNIGGFLAVLGSSFALKQFVTDTIAANAALERFSKNINLDVSTVSAWGNAVEEVGGSAKGLQGSMDMLSKAQTELRLTGQSGLIPYFSALGVSLATVSGQAKPVDQILLDLSERFSHMDRQTANNMGRMMGIDQDTLNLLLQGRREVELTLKRQKEFNAVSKEQAEEAVKLQRSLVGLKQSFTALGRDLLQQASPALEKMLSLLSEFGGWLQANREFVTDFADILGVIAAGFTAISIAASPIALTTAAIVALAAGIALLWDDYQTWKDGGDSLIDWEKWEPGIEAAKAGLKALRQDFKDTFQGIANDIDAAQKAFHGDWKGAKAALDRNKEITREEMSNRNTSIPTMLDAYRKAKAARPSGNTITSAQAMTYFTDRGLSAAEAAGLASQIHSESSGRAHLSGDNGAAYGLIQWHADRQANFAKMFGHDIRNSNADEQLAFMLHELRSTEKPAGDRLKGATTAAQAGDIASRYYVRPADVNGEARRRSSYAQMLAGVPGASGQVAAAGSSPAPAPGSADNSTTVTTGDIIIHTQATDANGIARDMGRGLDFLFSSQANTGLY